MSETSRLVFRKSSYSGATTQNCVEVAEGAATLVRDTQNRSAGYLSVPAREWRAFLEALKRDDI
ncbi:DUF397 domain-containing protein [Nocardiopsis sp. CNT-189]|uniref:DUF397 domain-containing protein n=1 Tax=Nocardiopsis oceanisediminis TaxID=2816862 RepID=UPI003B39791A